MISRHVQKLSRPAGLRASESPAIARWNVWLCRFACAGSNISTVRALGTIGLPATTEPMRPAPSISTRTLFSQPFGVSAVRANTDFLASVISFLPPD